MSGRRALSQSCAPAGRETLVANTLARRTAMRLIDLTTATLVFFFLL